MKRKYHEIEDLELMALVNSNDAEAIYEVRKRFYPLVTQKLGKMLPEDLDEAREGVFTNVWRYSQRYDPSRSKLVTWVGIIAERKSEEYSRNMRTKKRSLIKTQTQGLENIPGKVKTSDLLGQKMLRYIGERAREGDNKSIVLELHYHNGMTLKEISNYLGIPEGTVKARFNRGKQTLRKRFEKEAA